MNCLICGGFIAVHHTERDCLYYLSDRIKALEQGAGRESKKEPMAELQRDAWKSAKEIADERIEGLNAELETVRKERDVLRDKLNKNYPTQWAYEQVCQADEQKRKQINGLEAELQNSRRAHDETRSEYKKLQQKVANAKTELSL